jgi:uncharacterized RDD family membrane protein YckC
VPRAATPDDLPLKELGLPAELVTGEAVVLELRPASFATRGLALLLDLVVLVGIGFGLLFLVGAAAGVFDPAGSQALATTVFVSVLVGIPTAVETLTRGRSVGKLVSGLRVVRDDGGPIRFRQALVRALLAVPEIYLSAGSVAVIASLSNPRGKRVGDLLAGTYVVRERTGAVLAPPVAMPPELGPWADGIDLGRVPDALALAARSFLERAGGLNPASRQRLAIRLADALAQHVAPPPPAGTSPERFLAAVLAERRRRTLARLAQQARAEAGRDARRRSASPLSPTSTALVGEYRGRRAGSAQ